MKILIVDDEEIKRVSLSDDLSDAGHETRTAACAEEALELLDRGKFDVVLTDLRMPDVDGLDLLRRIQGSPYPSPQVILMTAYGNIPLAVEAMKLGAFDFITKPFRNESLLPVLARVEIIQETASRADKKEIADAAAGTASAVVGNTVSMLEVRRMIDLCARTDSTILLTGETGTGKDLVARTIHRLSARRSAPFVKVNCSTYSRSLVESELYGHKKGAFTGADRQRKGRIEAAHGGTLYLDDVDDIPLEQQTKLLRVIEEKAFERVGASELVKVDVRIIGSSKEDLLARIEEALFRRDLYYRLNVIRVDLPSLRDHREDLPLLVDHFLKRIAADRTCSVSNGAMQFMKTHTWPGNVRELKHALERAFLVGDGVITEELLSTDTGLCRKTSDLQGDFRNRIQQTELELLADALQKTGGNKSAAAKHLGMRLSTFRDKLTKHGLP